MKIITTSEDVKSGAELTKDEARLLQLYRHVDGDHQDYMLQFAEHFAASYRPAKPAPVKPTLRVVKGGAA